MNSVTKNQEKSEKQPTVLVLDRRTARLAKVVTALLDTGFAVHCAVRQTEAVELMHRIDFDLILIGEDDVQHGLSLVRNLCSRSLVTVLANATPSLFVKAMLASGATFVLHCTANEAHLRMAVAVLKSALEQRAIRAPITLPDYVLNAGKLIPFASVGAVPTPAA